MTHPASRSAETLKFQPVAVPVIPVDEIKEVTDNFGTNALIGEGSYGRVYHGLLKNGRATAIKKLDYEPENLSNITNFAFLVEILPMLIITKVVVKQLRKRCSRRN